MNETKPLNKRLIVFTLVVVGFLGTIENFTAPRYYSNLEAFIGAVGLLVLSPILIAWMRALWNTVVPRITGWREITQWEAAGLFVLVYFFVF